LKRTGWMLRLDLPSDPEMLSVVRCAMMRLTEELGFPAAECRGLTRAVDEALANIIRHAYGGRAGQPIELTCRLLKERTGKQRAGLEIILVDRGTPVDRKKLHGRALDDIRPGGLGLYLIQNAVDLMEYTTKGGKNRLRLVKYSPAVAAEAEMAKGGTGENFNPPNG
jgi:anti-sigma regulatory factor (Ser/Thr protein kinase)